MELNVEGLLKGKVAIITGASRKKGIGRACALVLAQMGANVVVTGTGGQPPGTLSEDEKKSAWRGAESVAEEMRSLGKKALALKVDVTNSASVQKMVTETVNQFGRADILVSNAAAPRIDLETIDLPEDIWENIIAVNLTGTYLCCKAMGKQLIAQGQGGRIIVIGSMRAKYGAARRSAYCASKFGQLGLVQCMAYEMARYKITVNAVCPGEVDTSRTDYGNLLGSQTSGMSIEELRSNNLKKIPLGRLARPEEIANSVGFLASPYADYITGHALMVTGGSAMS
jgi:3-oxoacyl-[acyl-carrier protein] reductase